ncbi:MAG TPA: ATP-binding protein [Opitutaceae bacterium]|nr:ATP-binding protein [Opitutaceae bacterium]
MITSAREFYDVPLAKRNERYPVRLTLRVFYYDPYWNLLWAESEGLGCYLPVRGVPLPLRSGDDVLIEGTVIPARGFDAADLKITELAHGHWSVPLATRGALTDVARFDARWVTIEGYVCRQLTVDAQHLELDVLDQGRVIETRVMLGSSEPIPQLFNARIRANCVYVANRNASGAVLNIAAWVPSLANIAVEGGLENDSRFNLPRTSIDHIGDVSEAMVHIIGEVWSADPGKSVTLRDASGQVKIRTQQPTVVQPGDFVEAVGRPTGHNIDATLLDPVFRIVPKQAGVAEVVKGSSPQRKLRLAEQLMELGANEAAQRLAVYLTAVVTWSDPKTDFLFVQDASGGVEVRFRAGSFRPPPPGRLVTVMGSSSEGNFSPVVQATAVKVVGSASYPTARPVTLGEAQTGSEEAERIEIRGFVRRVQKTSDWAQLAITTADGEFTAFLRPHDGIEDLVGSIVRIMGVCTAVANAQHQAIGFQLWVADPADVQILETRMTDPFSATERSLGSLRQFLAYHAVDRQVRLSGEVLYDEPGHYLYLQDGASGLRVQHRDTRPLAPGQWIEAVGLPGRDGGRLVLREGIWRPIAARTPIGPQRVQQPQQVDPDLDGCLVEVRGLLHDGIRDGNRQRLLLRTGNIEFEARLKQAAASVMPKEGSIANLTGVYVVDYDQYRQPHGFHLLLRSAGDIVVLSTPSWWTPRHAVTIAAAFAVCAFLGIIWVLVLRRRVRDQTAQIRAQLENEARLNAELERATRLESLGVLAGGIAHDFNNLLTVVMANVGLAAMDQRVQEAAGPILADAERGARRAAELTQQLLTFAKGGDPVRRSVGLAEVVREAADFARHGSQVRCDLEFEPDLPPANVDRAQISRVVHNLVLNARQAMPNGGVVTLRLASTEIVAGERSQLAPGSYVKLTVSDNGPGIAPENLARIFEPYFSTKPKNNGLGLATVHSIIKKHGGHIAVHSELGCGTRFEIWLPVAHVAPATDAPMGSAGGAGAPVRVLFMDDEEVIRHAAGAVLWQLGHDATLVGDGEAAVDEYKTALRGDRPYDVVILDLTVPGGLGGRVAMEMLQRIDPHVRAIVSSGYSQDPVLANFRAYGFSAVVPKPYEIGELARAIQEVMAMTVVHGV